MSEINVELEYTEHGDEWWVYRDDDLIAKFFGSEQDALDYADLKRLEP